MTTPLYRIRDNITKCYNSNLVITQDWKMYSTIDTDYDDDNCIIERCSGIKDKNWKRMFENDIVTFWLDYKDIKYTLIYEWMQWKISDWANLKFATDWKDLEVIGNIHQ